MTDRPPEMLRDDDITARLTAADAVAWMREAVIAADSTGASDAFALAPSVSRRHAPRETLRWHETLG